ncbi:MAG: NACHT domain-containing protein [Chloroflexota bacterium]|nr:NACHT domain-containing protein [Chloroflexota bacterium]MDE2961417.1 NACHT domain-containing protein [Chloroflexota bacterium]
MPFVKTLAKFAGSVNVGKLASSSGTVIDILGLMSGGGGIAVSVGAGALVGGVVGFAGGVAASQMMRRWSKDGGGEMPAHLSAELQSTPPEKVTKIFEVFADEVNQRATAALDDALADLMDSPDWDQDKARLDAAVTEWSRNRKEGAGSPLDHAETVQVLMSLIRNLREAKYRELFAEHHREVLSLDRPDWWRVEDVFIRLQAERREPGELTDLESDESGETVHKPEVLDFRGNTPVEVEDTLRKSGNLVILGEPGSGKSILLRFLAASCGESESNEALLPVRLRLRDYADSRKTLIAESAAKFAESDLQLKMPKNFFEHALKTGRCLVCLDALDEVPLGERRRIVKNVSQLAGNNSGNRFIVTSRIAGYDELPLNPKTFTRYVVQPMDDDGIRAFIDHLSPDDSERAQSLWDVVDTNAHIKSLVSNPLLMAMLNEVYQDDQEGLPLNRAKLYERVVDFLVEDKDDAGRKIDDDGHPRHKMLLTAIACSLHNENRETLGREELEELVFNVLLESQGTTESPTRDQRLQIFQEADAFIERAERRTGLLVEAHPGSDVFGFVHSTFREYLTAADIRDRHLPYGLYREECWEEIKNHLTDARWREVILLLLTSFEERYCTYLTKKILVAGDENFHQPNVSRLPTHLQLAADALANQAPMSPELQQDVVGRQRSHGSMHVFVATLGGLKHLPEIVVPELTAIATDPTVDARTREFAALRLAEMGERDTAIPVQTAIAADPAVDTLVRLHAARELANEGERDTAILSLTAIAADPTVDYTPDRLDAAQALADMGERDAAKTALAQLAQDTAMPADLRGRAGWLLGQLGEAQAALKALIDVVEDPAAGAMDKVRATGAIRKLIGKMLALLGDTEMAAAQLTSVAYNANAYMEDRIEAVKILNDLGDEAAAKTALQTIADDETVSNANRGNARDALRKLNEQ